MTPQERKNFESIRDNVHSEQAQKQEPVGRFSKFTDGVWREVTGTSAGQFLYASPPQRQPLTDETISTIYWGATGQSLRPQDKVLAYNFARAIETAHGIKEKNTRQDGNCKYCTNGCSACDARRQPNVLP
jgi:hypothetical protein